MSENHPASVQMDANAGGTVSFATDVVATIAGLAASEIEGVNSMVGTTGLADIWGRKNQSAGKSFTKGVRVDLNGQSAIVHLTIIVDYGFAIPEIVSNVQDNVKRTLETMTGLSVPEINIHIQGVSFEKENRSAQEALASLNASETPAAVEVLSEPEEMSSAVETVAESADMPVEDLSQSVKETTEEDV